MQFIFIIGGVAGWLLVSLIYGKLMPVMSLPTILAIVIGGIIAPVVGMAIVKQDNKRSSKKPKTQKRSDKPFSNYMKKSDSSSPNQQDSSRCPKCGFTYSWDGNKCGHCGFEK